MKGYALTREAVACYEFCLLALEALTPGMAHQPIQVALAAGSVCTRDVPALRCIVNPAVAVFHLWRTNLVYELTTPVWAHGC